MAGIGGRQAHGAVINGAKYNFGAEPWSIEGKFHKQEVSLASPEKPGTIVISTSKRFLYLVLGNGRALRYGIGVGRRASNGRASAGVRKAEWPDWTPPKEMRRRDPMCRIHEWRAGNPLGARAMYLGSTSTASMAPPALDHRHQRSSGCIRLTNDDVTDLYERVKVGTKVIVE